MRLIRFILFNAFIWGIFHLLISALMLNFNIHKRLQFNWLFNTYRFEQSGETWNKIFKIKQLKNRLPESTLIMPGSFDSSQIPDTEAETLKDYISEANRAELTHWISILPAPLFFLWNPRKYWVLHLLYAGLSNMPFILAQRYNRPRLKKLYKLKYERVHTGGLK